MKRLNQNMHGDDDAWYRLPQDRELAAQYLLLYELSLPYGRDLTNRVDLAKSATRITVSFDAITSRDAREFDARARTWLAENLPSNMQTRGASVLLMFAHIWDDTIRGSFTGLALAVLLISVIIALGLKSIRLGMISLIPNIFPALMAFGVWGLFVGKIDVGSSIVAIISFGIIVDDTVHFLSKYHYSRTTLGAEPAASVEYAFVTVGPALLISSIVLIVGFATLSFSTFTPNADMGSLTGLVIAFALTLDFLLLPAVLLRVDV